MEAQGQNPYEQQLLSVYESCLEKDKLGLNEKGLKLLCDKLQLEERSVKLIETFSKQSCEDYAITFDEFRNGLLHLLDNSEELPDNSNNTEVIDDLSIINKNKYSEGVALECDRLEKLYADNSNGDSNVIIKNSPVMSIIDESVIPKSMLQQIFQKLDLNCDGQINFDEFLTLFQSDQDIEENSFNVGTWNNESIDDSNCSRNQHITMLGPEHTSFIERRVVINLWQTAGVIDPTTLLHELGFTSVNINLTELMAVINDELKILEHELRNGAVTMIHVNLLRGALVLYQEEVRSMNTLNDQLTRERDKLKADVSEANESANILAQENDENHIKMEKTRQEQIKQLEMKHSELMKELSIQNNCEREAYMAKVTSLHEQLDRAQQEEQLIRSKLADALNENHTLEIGNQNLIEQISKLKMSNNELLRQVSILAAEHDEAERNEEIENEHVISLVERIKKLQIESSLLRDQNDELTSEVESLRARTNHYKVKDSNMNSNIFDSEESNSVSDYEPLGQQLPELKVAITDDKITSLSNTIALIIHDLKNITLDRKTATCSSDCVLKRNLSDIIVTLESQILARIPAKIDSCEKNEEGECEERTSESLRDFVVNKSDKGRINTSIPNIDDEIVDNLDMNAKSKVSSLRDYPPRRGELCEQSKSDDDKNNSRNSLNNKNSPDFVDDNNSENIKQDTNKLNDLLKDQEIKFKNEKKQLQEQCVKLENDLQLLRAEYYQCEDYWAGKLEEERQLIEQEQKISDEKLGELIAKIAEYEEQFSMSDKSRNDGKLSPIDEKLNLEQQYNDLEDEYRMYKKQCDEKINEKDIQLALLQKKLDENKIEMIDTYVQVSDISENRTMRKALCQPNTIQYHYVLPTDLSNINNASEQTIVTNMNHHGMTQKFFEPGKLNKIAEHSISDNRKDIIPSIMTISDGDNSSCSYNYQYLDPSCTMNEFSKKQKVEIQKTSQKRAHNNLSLECNSLIKQKESLIDEIMELQNFRSDRFYSDIDGQVTNIDMNFIKSLMTKLQIQDQKKKNLQVNLKHQKQNTEKILEQTWKQHCNEIANIHHVLKETQNSLHHQIQMNAICMEKLSKSDLLLKDLYVENAYLKANVERLGERCHMLAHLGSGSTSV